MVSSSVRTWAPNQDRIWAMNFTSLSFGTRRMTQGSEVSSVAARIGSTAFLAPPIVTSPCSGSPPFINKLSMKGGLYSFLVTRPVLQRVLLAVDCNLAGPLPQSTFPLPKFPGLLRSDHRQI